RDHDLAGAVVVRRPDPEDAAAELLDDLVLEAEDRRHRAGVLPRRLGHRETALADERDRLGRADRAGGGARRALADRAADDVLGLDAACPQRRQPGEARRDERGLLHLRLDELFERRVEAEPLEVAPTSP